MAKKKKRTDDQSRVLFDGELQRNNGQYEYRYYDDSGNRKSIYSWRLTADDPVPKGKRNCKPLRDLIAEINHVDILTNAHVSRTATLNERFDVYIKGKLNLHDSTRQNYIYMYDSYVRNSIGKMSICDFNYTIIQNFYNELITVRGFKPSSVENIHTILNPIFEDAVTDDIFRTNPCSRAMKKIRESNTWAVKELNPKHALTATQQKNLIDYIRGNKAYSRWVNVLTVLLGTGLRIGECSAITSSSCDFKNNFIHVKNTLSYRQWEDGKCYYRLFPVPKTKDGIRSIPMLDKVREALLAELEYQKETGPAKQVIDGVSDWVFTNRFHNVLSADSVNSALSRIVRDYNLEEQYNAKKEKRKPNLLPHITNHTLRHCFCTRLMEESCKPGNNISLKLIQSLMGHADFKTTMDIYTDVSEEFKKNSAQMIEGNIYLG